MNERNSSYPYHRWRREGAISAVSVGLFLILVGVIVAINQNLWPKIQDFFNDFTTANVTNTNVTLPIPATPAAHTAVYAATFQLALGIAILEVLILAMRLAMGSRIRRTAQTVGNLVFWFGAAYLLNWLAGMKSTLAISQQRDVWFQFWAGIIIMFGVSLLARAAIAIAARQTRPKQKPI